MSEVELERFDPSHAERILGWARSAEERDAWASIGEAEARPDIFRTWHRDPDVHPFVLHVDGETVGYGEVWEDREAAEVELARIIVDPERRGRGLGRRLVELLVREATARGFTQIWVRVVPTNGPALACYRSAGFDRATPEEEAAFNRGQPRGYVWMRR